MPVRDSPVYQAIRGLFIVGHNSIVDRHKRLNQAGNESQNFKFGIISALFCDKFALHGHLEFRIFKDATWDKRPDSTA